MPPDHNPADQLNSDFEITVTQDRELAKLYSVYRFIQDVSFIRNEVGDTNRQITLAWYFIKGQCSDINIMQVNSDMALELWKKAKNHYLADSNGESTYVPLLDRLNHDISILDCY
jgi:hypothetical protein